MDDEHIHDLIGRIYEAASAPELWPAIVREIKAATDSNVGLLWLGNPNISVEEFAANQGDFLAYEHNGMSLADYYDFVRTSQDPSITEPYAAIADRVPLNQAVVGSAFVPINEFRKTEFYHQIAQPVGGVHQLGSIMARRNGRINTVVFYRSDDAPNYGRTEVRFLDALVPHVRRSLALYHRLRAADTRAFLLQSSVNALTSAVLLLDQTGKVVFLNDAAERLIARCPKLRLRCDRLCAVDHADLVKLERLLKIVTGANGFRPSGGAVTIARGSGEQALQIAAAALPSHNRGELAGDLGAVAMVVIHDPSERPYISPEIVRAMFGLTPAEANVLLALSRGQTLDQYSDQNRISKNTARTHLRGVFAKTKTSRQSDLVRLMSGLLHSVALTD